MTVRELIAELLNCDMDANVTVNVITKEEDFDKDFTLNYQSNTFSSYGPYLELDVDLKDYVIKEDSDEES